MIPVVYKSSDIPRSDDLPDNLFIVPYFTGNGSTEFDSGGIGLGVNDGDTVKTLIHGTGIVEGGIQSVHTRDDSTSYQNLSGNTAIATLVLVGNDTGTEPRHIKLYSAPDDDSTASGAVLLYEADQASLLASSSDVFTTPPLPISNNHYLVIENVDESRGGTNNITANFYSAVVERI